MSLLVERFGALDALADYRGPLPTVECSYDGHKLLFYSSYPGLREAAHSLYYMPHRVVFLEQIARYLNDECQRVNCRKCGEKRDNLHVVEATKDCQYPEGWEKNWAKEVEDTLSKYSCIISDELRAKLRAVKHFLNDILRMCRDQYHVAEVRVSCKCIQCGKVREWILDSSFLGLLSERYPYSFRSKYLYPG